MGNCVSAIKGKGQRLDITLLAVGLDNAGKTTTVHGVKGDLTSEVAPTIGFSQLDLQSGNYNVKIFDLGGGARIRGIWKNYFAEAHGIVYVIDSSDTERMEECRANFDELISDSRLRGKPVLILANKQDKPNAIDELDLCERMNLDEVVNRNESFSKVILCSALPTHGRSKKKRSKLDRGINNGYLWLLDMIGKDYEKIQNRIKEDVEQQKEKEAREKAERLERVRKRREERERLEQIGDDRPAPEGMSHHELPNDVTNAHEKNTPEPTVKTDGVDYENPATREKTECESESRKSKSPDDANQDINVPDDTAMETSLGDQLPGNVIEESVYQDVHLVAIPGAVPSSSVALETGDATISSAINMPNHEDEVPEHPRALSAASLRELVRDAPSPIEYYPPNESVAMETSESISTPANPDSVVSLQDENLEVTNISSSKLERKKKRKKKRRKHNKVDPRFSEDNSSEISVVRQGKLTPIKSITDSNSNGYGKLPPIRNSPNFNSDVES